MTKAPNVMCMQLMQQMQSSKKAQEGIWDLAPVGTFWVWYTGPHRKGRSRRGEGFGDSNLTAVPQSQCNCQNGPARDAKNRLATGVRYNTVQRVGGGPLVWAGLKAELQNRSRVCLQWWVGCDSGGFRWVLAGPKT